MRATPSGWSIRSPPPTRPSASMTACRRRWRRSSPPIATAWWKLKVGGNVAADVDRLCRIASVLDRLHGYHVSLDGNEQYEDADGRARAVARDAGGTAAGAAERLDRLHRAAGEARPGTGRRDGRARRRAAGDRGRERRAARCLRAGQGAGLHRHIVQGVQGGVAVAGQPRALPRVERGGGRAALLHERRGSDDARRRLRSAGPGAGQRDGPRACRAQRTSLRRWLRRPPQGRGGALHGSPSRRSMPTRRTGRGWRSARACSTSARWSMPRASARRSNPIPPRWTACRRPPGRPADRGIGLAALRPVPLGELPCAV